MDGIPSGYEQVDPRTARRVPLWHELSPDNPIFPGDPEFRWELFSSFDDAGYLLERITSLGTHTGTHVSAPAHFRAGAPYVSQLDEGWTLMPLAVLDVFARVAAGEGAFTLDVRDLQQFEHRHGRIPEAACLLLLTGFARRYDAPTYFDPAPGFTRAAVAWLFAERGIKAIGSDTFGPDASSDRGFEATASALAHGGITIENVGVGLEQMRPYGDWVALNGARARFSGFPVGITGFTVDLT